MLANGYANMPPSIPCDMFTPSDTLSLDAQESFWKALLQAAAHTPSALGQQRRCDALAMAHKMGRQAHRRLLREHITIADTQAHLRVVAHYADIRKLQAAQAALSMNGKMSVTTSDSTSLCKEMAASSSVPESANCTKPWASHLLQPLPTTASQHTCACRAKNFLTRALLHLHEEGHTPEPVQGGAARFSFPTGS